MLVVDRQAVAWRQRQADTVQASDKTIKMNNLDPQRQVTDTPQAGDSWNRRDTVWWLATAVLMCGGLYLLSRGSRIAIMRRESYLIFHSIVELSSIAVVWGVFLLMWSARRIVRNDALVFLGTAFLFVGLLDLLHMLAYEGMHIFPGPGESNRATQLWMAARAMESLSLLVFPVLFGRHVRSGAVFGLYALATWLLLASIFAWGAFPLCYIDGVGLTAFKKASEYVICGVLLGAILLLRFRRGSLDAQVYRFMVYAIVVSIASELAFTLYASVFGLPNLFGHVAKIASHILVCLALIRAGLSRPYSLLFRELSEKEAALAEENRIRNVLLNALPYPTMLIRRDRTIVLANRVAQEVGATVGGVCWDAFGHRDYIPPEDQEYIQRHECAPPDGTCCTFCQADEAMDAQQGAQDPEVNAFGRIWDTFWIPIDDEIYLHYAQDVTDIRHVLAEKDALLREVHHRVKNNLQVVVSLLRLQARRIDVPEAVEVLRECESRVKAMALVHETLYRSKEFSAIDASRYVSRLCDDVARTHGGGQRGIDLTVHSQAVRLPMEQAVPVGLIISELVSNAFKHAFPDGRRGEILVELRQGEADQVELIITDDGVGIPPEIDPASAVTVGLGLVTETVRGQLGGSIEIERSHGVRFEIRFRIANIQQETRI
jgi:two-component sensor histidine kinase